MKYRTELEQGSSQKRKDDALLKHRDGNAMTVVRKLGILPGTGVYTAGEIWHIAGEH